VLADHHEPMVGSWHAHRRAQLVHAAEGVLVVSTEAGRFVAPPERAVWVPGGTRHSVASRRPFQLLTLYVDPDFVPLPNGARVVAVDRLVAELLAAAAKFGTNYPRGAAEERLIRVLLDRLLALEVAPLHLPDPQSSALIKIADALAANPADRRTLGEWCTKAGMTERTAARRFVAETGMTFGRWRQQLRLLTALERLGAGESVTIVALEVGYEDVSSFIAAFKAAMGETPARYFRKTLA
jgi:AraC-like DNA-binding protein